VGQRSRAGGAEIPCCMEQWLHGPMGQGLVCRACYSFSIWWSGKTSHELRIRSADVSALPGVLPQSSKSPASYQSPCIRGQKVCGCVLVAILESPILLFQKDCEASPCYIARPCLKKPTNKTNKQKPTTITKKNLVRCSKSYLKSFMMTNAH
jgi:hypothetical protein